MSVDDLFVDDLPVDDLSVDDLPVDDPSVDDLPVDDLSVDGLSDVHVVSTSRFGGRGAVDQM